ncbi:hypothetical protein [Micromonospora sp. NPDC004551]|uniref:hypothetical protein n=1 Tax=Micromonospora sp. NPDC004551 TaxID=3154284 RepID=UPI0033B864BD
MFVRNLARVGISASVMAAGVFGFGVAAQAAPSSFTAKAIHANGAGALAAQATGGLAWYNRSATLTNVAFYVAANECGRFTVIGMQGSSYVDSYDYPSSTGCVRPGSTGRIYDLKNIALDGSDWSGGITDIFVYAVDVDHNVTGFAKCGRAASNCVAGQY